MADGILKVGQITNSAGSGNITIGSGVTVNVNRAAFLVVRTSDQSTTSATYTKIQGDTVILDTDSCYDTSTYKFTPTVAGKYFVFCSTRLKDDANDLLQWGAKIDKNGSQYKENYSKGTAQERGATEISTIVDMNGSSDYLEFYAWGVAGSGNPTLQGDLNNKSSSFGAYKLGA